MSGKRWSDGEIKYIRLNYGEESIGDIAKKLGRSENAVYIKATLLKLGTRDFGRKKDIDDYAIWWENNQILNKIRIKLGKPIVPDSANPYGGGINV